MFNGEVLVLESYLWHVQKWIDIFPLPSWLVVGKHKIAIAFKSNI